MPAGGGSSPSHSGGFGHHALRYYGRSVRCFTGLGQAGTANARETARGLRLGWRSISSRAPATSQEAWPEAELVWWQPTNQSRSGTPTGERAKADGCTDGTCPRCARRIGRCGGFCQRLSAFCFLFYFFFFVAWVERSETRGRLQGRDVLPGFRFAQPRLHFYCFLLSCAAADRDASGRPTAGSL